MDKKITGAIMLICFIGLTMMFLFGAVSRIVDNDVHPVATKQYDSPIGPVQEKRDFIENKVCMNTKGFLENGGSKVIQPNKETLNEFLTIGSVTIKPCPSM